MCPCGGELVECVCGDRCCDDCGCTAEDQTAYDPDQFDYES